MNQVTRLYLLLALLLPGLLGCSKEKMDEMVGQAKNAATNATAKVSDSVQDAKENALAQATDVAEKAGDLSGVADMTGKAKITLDGPTEFGASFVRLVKLNPGRPSVLQIKSYRDGDLDSYPSFLVQAQVTETDLRSLSGKPIEAKFFAQKTPTGPVWHSPDDQPAALSLSFIDGIVSAKIESAELLNTETGQSTVANAIFDCAPLD